MQHFHSHIDRVAMGLLFVASVVTAPALATPGSGFVPSPIATGHYGALDLKADKVEKWDLFLKTKAETDVGADQLTVAAGGYSGWHSHPAPVFITVLSGEIQWFDGGDPLCTWKTYHAGQSFIEQPFRVHQVRNVTSVQAQFIGIRMAPTGVGFRIDERKPTNCE